MMTKTKSISSIQYLALWTHVKHEIDRMLRIPLQVFLPSVITTLLYFLIFGAIIGKRIGTVNHIDYTLFIAPGLVMISVITNAYANTASSVFSARFQHSIEELLVSPMHPSVFLLGYVLGGTIRGVMVAVFVILVAYFFIELSWARIPFTLLWIILFSMLFSLAGFINGMLARNFDDVFLVPTFILSPLTYLGGVFYTIDMLPHFWHQLARFNPIFYMINALRDVMINQHFEYFYATLVLVCALIFVLFATAMHLFKRGVGIRT